MIIFFEIDAYPIKKNGKKDDFIRKLAFYLVFLSKALLNMAVDFRCRRSLSAGVPGSLLGAEAPAGSPRPRTPAGH